MATKTESLRELTASSPEIVRAGLEAQVAIMSAWGWRAWHTTVKLDREGATAAVEALGLTVLEIRAYSHGEPDTIFHAKVS